MLALRFAAFILLGGATCAQTSPNELVRLMVANELRSAEHDRSLWRYQSRIQKDGKAFDIESIDTTGGTARRVIAINGQPLAGDDLKKEEERVTELLTDPKKRDEQLKESQADAERCLKMFRMFPDAFLYQEAGRDGDVVRLTFQPRPEFEATDRESKVFKVMSGEMWIHVRQQRLVRVSGVLGEDVKFGFGLLGYLRQGGTFTVEKTEVAPNQWQLSLLDVNMDGRILLMKTLTVKEREENRGFVRVPDTLDYAQGMELLKSPAAPIIAARGK